MDSEWNQPAAHLEKSLWERFLALYFEFAIRIIAYCSSWLIFSAFYLYRARSVTTDIGIILYGIVCYGFIEWCVAKVHKPKFVSEDHFPRPKGLPVLKKRDYDDRLRAERLLYESGFFWLVNVTLGFFLAFPKGAYRNLLWGGGCFVPAVWITFVGLVLSSLQDAKTGKRPVMAYFMSPLLILPPILCTWAIIWFQYLQ